MKAGDAIEPTESSTMYGHKMYHNNTFVVNKVINDDRIEVIRNGWHKFEALKIYFKKSNK